MISGAPYGPVRIGLARPVTDDNSQMMINQLRGRLAAAAAEAANSANCTAVTASIETTHGDEVGIIPSRISNSDTMQFDGKLENCQKCVKTDL